MKKYAKETSTGIFVLVGLACVAYLTITLGKAKLFNGNTYLVTACFTSISGLKPGAEVEIAGVPVGRVTCIKLDQKYSQAVAFLRIRKDVILSDDTIASIKTSGLVGDKYIQLSTSGFGNRLNDGDRITETESAVDLEGLISKYVFGGFIK